MTRPKLATVWLDGCSGCHMSLLDIDERLLTITERADLVYSPLVDNKVFPDDVDVVLVEGAGSPAEINLRAGDIANMGFAIAADLPVVLIGDIDRGGVIASLVGTKTLLAPEEAARVKGFLINKFRGDLALFADGVKAIADRTGFAPLGVIPWFDRARDLPAEDGVALDGAHHGYAARPMGREGGAAIKVVVPHLPRISNFDDLDPLRAEPKVSVLVVAPGQPLPQSADLILIPGSKATRADLRALRQAGWDTDIRAHARAGKAVIGICGGYQMLGRTIADPLGIEGAPGTSEGLGLLEVDTVLTEVKQLRTENARHLASGTPIAGYHMHLGETSGPDAARPFAEVNGAPEGAVSGRVAGTYLHGIFASDPFRHAFLNVWADQSITYEAGVESALDGLAAHLASHLDLDQLVSLAAEV